MWGCLHLFNESNQWIQLTLPDGGTVGLPAWWARFYYLSNVQGPVLWQVLATIATVANPCQPFMVSLMSVTRLLVEISMTGRYLGTRI